MCEASKLIVVKYHRAPYRKQCARCKGRLTRPGESTRRSSSGAYWIWDQRPLCCTGAYATMLGPPGGIRKSFKPALQKHGLGRSKTWHCRDNRPWATACGDRGLLGCKSPARPRTRALHRRSVYQVLN